MQFARLSSILLAISAFSAVLRPTGAQDPDNTIPVLIRFNDPPGQAQADLVSSHGGSVTRQFRIVPAVAARIPPGAAAALRNAPGIAAVEPDGIVTAHGEYDVVWGVNKVKAPVVHSGAWIGPDVSPVPIKGTGIRVAVLDTGIDYTHPDLWANYSGGYDFVNNDSDPRDDQGHGTHVSGTIAGLIDGAGVVGVAPEVDLYALKVLSSTGSGSFSASFLPSTGPLTTACRCSTSASALHLIPVPQCEPRLTTQRLPDWSCWPLQVTAVLAQTPLAGRPNTIP